MQRRRAKASLKVLAVAQVSIPAIEVASLNPSPAPLADFDQLPYVFDARSPMNSDPGRTPLI
jgi:hypothetical protein